MTSAITIDHAMPWWGIADLIDAAADLTGGDVPSHVVTRAMRKFRDQGWIEHQRDPDMSMGPRYLYRLTAAGREQAIAAAGRELAAGEEYPLIPLRLLPLPKPGGRLRPAT